MKPGGRVYESDVFGGSKSRGEGAVPLDQMVRVGLTYITGHQGWLWQEGEKVGSEMGVG